MGTQFTKNVNTGLLLRPPPIVAYELAHTIFSYILIGEREELSVDQEIVSYTHFKVT